MTARYNPHSIEKQARQWPVLLSCSSLDNDIRNRFAQLWQEQTPGFISPFACEMPFTEDLQREYGTDACRIACLSQSGLPRQQELEPAFKWLARLYQQLNRPVSAFAAAPWLEAAYRAGDHVRHRENAMAALTELKHAVRLAPPGINLADHENALVAACLYPFAPLLAAHIARAANFAWQNLALISESFANLVCVRYALENGGWQQKVFNRQQFAADPLRELKSLKQVRKAIGARPASISQTEWGLKICFL